MMRIDTPEKAAALNAAYHDAEKRGPLKFPEGLDYDKIFDGDEEYLKNNPDWFEVMLDAAKEWMKEKGMDVSGLM